MTWKGVGSPSTRETQNREESKNIVIMIIYHGWRWGTYIIMDNNEEGENLA